MESVVESSGQVKSKVESGIKLAASKVVRSWVNGVSWHLRNLSNELFTLGDLVKKYKRCGYKVNSEFAFDHEVQLRGLVFYCDDLIDKANEFTKAKRVVIWGNLSYDKSINRIKYVDIEFVVGVYDRWLKPYRNKIEEAVRVRFREMGFRDCPDIGCLVGEFLVGPLELMIENYYEFSRVNYILISSHKNKQGGNFGEVYNRC